MTAEILQIAIYIIALIVLTPILGTYMAKVFVGERTFMTPLVRPIEKTIYSVCGVDENEGMDWKILYVGGHPLSYSRIYFSFYHADISGLASA